MRVNYTLIRGLLLVMVLTSLCGVALATDVSTILGLWNVRNNLSGDYLQTATIDLSVTNPTNLTAWAASTAYAKGDIRKHTTDGFAYYCITAHTSGTDFVATNWTKMWEAAKGWEPIGFQTGTEYSNAFTGNYNGAGHTISNLYINRGATSTGNNTFPATGTNHVGLFGFVSSNSTANNYIKNVKLTAVNITGKRGTGALIGKVMMPSNASKKTTVEKCSVSGGTVSGFGATGGLVGANNSDRKQQVPVIQYCSANVTVSSTESTNAALNSGDNNNPYNIKYGGLVGCNETGVTFDSFALGNVSGGDRVGGLAGCTIAGAVIRCYATGNVSQGISSTTWEGGIGGVTGRIVGKLPPGLGGFQGSGSVQYSYYNSGITITSAGGPVNTTGLQSSTTMTTTAIGNGIYSTWDPDVWSAVSSGYPIFDGDFPEPYYYKSTTAGNWSVAGNWKKSATSGGTYNVAAATFPDFSHSAGIIVDTDMTLDLDVSIDDMLINSGKTLTINTGKKLYVENNTTGFDLTNKGTLIVTGTFEVGQSASFENQGTFTINDNFINSGTTTWTSGTPSAGTSSTITYNGAVAQATGTGFPGTIQNMVIDNAAGVTFSSAFNIDGTLTVNQGVVSGSSNADGYHSAALNYLEIAESGVLINGFSTSSSSVSGNYPTYIMRQWVINGTIPSGTTTKTLTFYWTAADDNSFNWTSIAPALFVGSSATGVTGTFTNGDPRKLVVSYDFPTTKSGNGAKETFKIGRSDDQTLPVELSFFNAQVFQGNSIMLQWKTQSETNVSGFQIYRGVSDDLAEAGLLDIFVNATNTSQTQYYVYYDRELDAPGTYCYWLESVDFDGSSDLFGPIPVHYEAIEPNIPSIPAITGINKNYPNPFNPSTTIVFGMHKDGELAMDVYNTRGQKVRSLYQGSRKSGWYRLEWDGKNDRGQQLSSGVYFFRMQANGETHLHKTVMLK